MGEIDLVKGTGEGEGERDRCPKPGGGAEGLRNRQSKRSTDVSGVVASISGVGAGESVTLGALQ